MISIKRLYPKKFAYFWNKDARVLLVGLYYFVVGIDFGLTKSNFYKHFYRNCIVCKKPLIINHRLTTVKWHKDCRKEGRRIEYKQIKNHV